MTATKPVAKTDKLTSAGLDRRLKRHLLKEPQQFFAVTTPGFEKILESDIREIQGVVIGKTVVGGVEFSGPLQSMYHACLRLRSANRIIMRISSFTARSYPELFNKAKRIDWELYTGFTAMVKFDASSRQSRLHHTDNMISSVYDAFSTSMKRLGVKTMMADDAPLTILVRFERDVCTISIDVSGPHLFKRGYRVDTAHAPLRESIAAGLLKITDWHKFPVIADPLCGSGTFLIEAALLARNKMPGAIRTFSFEQWPSFNASFWDRLKRTAKEKETATCPVRLLASDISPKALNATRSNAERAGVGVDIATSCADCLIFNKDGGAGHEGLIIANLPYGKRAFTMKEQLKFEKSWGDHLREFCKGWHFGFLVEDEDFVKNTGLTVLKMMKFNNGGIKVMFVTGRV